VIAYTISLIFKCWAGWAADRHRRAWRRGLAAHGPV